MGLKAKMARAVLGTLLAVGIWYGRPVLAEVIETAGHVAAALEGRGATPRRGDVDPGEGAEQTPCAPDPAVEGEGALPEAHVPDAAADAVRWARADAAERSLAPEGAVRVVSVQPVQWRDSSLGCARGGGMYMQVITPGYRILIQAGDDLLEYHSAEGRPHARLCNPDVVQARDRERSRDLLLAPGAPPPSTTPERPTR
jgi:hypothetical protein